VKQMYDVTNSAAYPHCVVCCFQGNHVVSFDTSKHLLLNVISYIK
jgi:hypothetical protein